MTSRIKALITQYDEKWSALDLAGVAELWERRSPSPIYLGDEYALPLMGADELDRHWARLAGRLTRASVSSRLWSADILADGVARCVLLSRWRFTGAESDSVHAGTSWITWLLKQHSDGYRIFHHMESQVYLEEDFPAEPEEDKRA
ncbi:hypothetical protein [Mycobacterium kubicae]|uniref:hypothetical protein n=1 Tax=Mycobacterium kubicae TaxID=120959 RepID=UPI0007FF906C|nr:hypothetical protein [Mycobacterium kubicae]OBF17697.1 hypothetical protein A5725_22690 [Mycobacterium kubicae]OBK48117.1 hypothetical protein A5657_23675 [Mycobacterium kubicae]QNI07974.1 hypothetical protein GAN17_18140 [Mycobacterium kubicae]